MNKNRLQVKYERKRGIVMNGIGFISEVRGICIKNTVWYYQEFDDHEGNLECYRLYNSEGEFVDEFTDYTEMRDFCKSFTRSSK